MSDLNGVMMQYFHWYIAGDGTLWKQVAENAKDLSERGITSLWLPPAYKGAGGGYDTGYGVYDLFDLGEFDQKGSVRTKYGTKAEYITAVKAANEVGIRIYADAVFNHKMGADAEEEVEARPFNLDNRNEPLGEYQKIKAWTHFTFPGRHKKHSTMEWHWHHFTAIDHNTFDQGKRAVFLFKDKGFDSGVDLEKGNFDYLMGCDLDMDHPEVSGELVHWGQWFVNETGVDGFRFDAVKHVNARFFEYWLDEVKAKTQKDLFAVGEYWSYEVAALDHFIGSTQGNITLFDAPLHLNFHLASKAGNSYDMRKIFDNTLVQKVPTLAVTIVENHDTQPLQALESLVEGWFKPLAYALILLRREGYPCIFYADYYGAKYKDKGKDGHDYEIVIDSQKFLLDKFLHARRCYAYGEQYDYFDHGNVVGWTRQGDDEHKGGMAVLLSNGDTGTKRMQARPNQIYVDITEHIKESITTDAEGWGEFRCNAGSVSVWTPHSS
jgi:alpha-amylase